MTQILLCAGPGLLVIKKDGQLFYRRPGQPDAPVPYAPEYYPVFLNSARQKHGLAPVLGASGEEAPFLQDDAPMPALLRDRLASGEEAYRLQPVGEIGGNGDPTAKSSDSRSTPLTT
jgi:hypothetical protein